ncbi:unnamed protein product [Auanema sp. JU1783]|nr:unnamed protein product [Auanema sp. JU1783]
MSQAVVKQWNESTASVKVIKDVHKKNSSKRLWIKKPIHVWREQFLEDRCVSPSQLYKELLISAFPHILLNGLLIIYILFGGLIFSVVDDEIRRKRLSEVVLFAFTTITTIGYGDVTPSNYISQMSCILYCLIGIPLIFLVLTNNGQFLTEAYNIWMMSYHKQKTRFDSLPLSVSLMLLLIHSLIGGLIFSTWIDSMPFISAVYFSFISIATIGFGDITPTPENPFQVMIIILYMSLGIIALSTLLGSLSSYLKWIHSIGRTFKDSQDFEVWLGGDVMTIGELVVTISKQFQVDPKQLQYVLRDLDSIITTCMVSEGGDNCAIVKTSPEEKPKMMNLTSCAMELSQQQQKPTFEKSPPEDTKAALHALGVLHHKIKKQGSFHRSTSSASLRSMSRSLKKNDPEKCDISTCNV